MELLNLIGGLLGASKSAPQAQKVQNAPQPQLNSPINAAPNLPQADPRSQLNNYTPDITYNPNPNTNIPYSTHSATQAQQLATPQSQNTGYTWLQTLLNRI